MNHNITFPKLGLEFDVNTTAFSIGSFSVQWYGIIIACGFMLAILYGYAMAKKMNIDRDKFFDGIIVGLICGVVGARLYYCIFYPGDKYINNPLEILNIKEGGLAIYGGIIGGLLGGGITCKLRKLKVAACIDTAVVGFTIGQCIGRWGNFINQEAFGGATSLPWGMQSDATEKVVVGPVHPCFLYESLWMLLGFILLHLFTRYKRRYDGQTTLMYMLWYGIGRFFIEGLRTDSLTVPGLDIRVSQLISAAMVIVSVVLLIVFRKRTALTGCGSKEVMELNGLSIENGEIVVKDISDIENEPKKSTIFADDDEEESEDNASEKTEEKSEEKSEDNSERSVNSSEEEEEKSEESADTEEKE